MQPAKDYLAMRTVAPGDKLDFGVRGMRWGVTRSRAERAAASGKKTEAPTKTTVKTTTKTTEPAGSTGSTHKAPYEGETSSQRYSRLASQAKAGKASEMTEPDLKFFNSRTEAIAKVNKMYETKPNWVVEAAKTAGKQAVQQTMSNVAKGVAEKYVSGPILDGLTGGKGTEAKAAVDIAKAVSKPMTQAVKEQSVVGPAMPSLASRARSAVASRQARQTAKYGPKVSGLGYIERDNTSYPAKK